MAKLSKMIVFPVSGEMHAYIRAEAKRRKMTMAKLLRTLVEQQPGYNEHAVASLPPQLAKPLTKPATKPVHEDDIRIDIDDLLDYPEK